MAKVVLKEPEITIGAVDLSDHISQVEISTTYDTPESTAFGDAAKTYEVGLPNSTVGLTLHQDFDASEVEATIGPLVGTKATVAVKPGSGSVSATNPSYTATVIVNEWMPITGSVGELLEVNVTWQVSGAVTKATA